MVGQLLKTSTQLFGHVGFAGAASLDVHPVTEVTLDNLSFRGALKALELGYAPAVSIHGCPEVVYCDHCRIVYAPWQWSRLGQTFVFCDDCMPLAREQASLSRTGDDFIKWVYCLPDDYEF